MLNDSSDADISPESFSSWPVETLRARARTALLYKRKAEARDILGQLVGLSQERVDLDNLTALIKGVETELGIFTGQRGDIRRRLMDGTPLEEIHDELNQRIPHWRAFANDLPALEIARTGLPAHEDPSIQKRFKNLEAQLISGEVESVVAEWLHLGAPAGASNPNFAQLVGALAILEQHIAGRRWGAAQSAYSEVKMLLESDSRAAFRDGVTNYLRLAADVIKWESLLSACKEYISSSNSSSFPSRAAKNRVVQDLNAAVDGIALRVRKHPALAELQTRLFHARDVVESAEVTSTNTQSSSKWPALILLGMVVALIYVWIHFRVTNLP